MKKEITKAEDMTKTIEDKSKFIELRALGYSFDKIASEIGVSKPTLIKWQGECSSELEEARFTELENIFHQYHVMRKNRVETQAKLLQAVNEELATRAQTKELKGLETDKLVKLALILEERLVSSVEKVEMTVPGSLGSWAKAQQDTIYFID